LTLLRVIIHLNPYISRLVFVWGLEFGLHGNRIWTDLCFSLVGSPVWIMSGGQEHVDLDDVRHWRLNEYICIWFIDSKSRWMRASDWGKWTLHEGFWCMHLHFE